ncbi:two-component regulator propeller domain-containing protein, partial [Saccharophagus degradans]
MLKNTNSYKIILIIQLSMILFFNIYTSYAQRIEKFSNLEGFNQNTVNTIEQDAYGFLWIGTANGLIKYD